MIDTQKTTLKTRTHFTQSGNIKTHGNININRKYFGQATTQKSYFTIVDYGLQGCDNVWFCL
jgi:heat shock protein HslJ